MKHTLVAGLAGLSLALSGLAGTAIAADSPAAAATTAVAAAPAPVSVDKTPISELVDNPATKAVLDKHIPGVAEHPSYDMFKGMTLAEVAPMSQGAVTGETLVAIQADLDKLGK
jgi:hypothetical protein